MSTTHVSSPNESPGRPRWSSWLRRPRSQLREALRRENDQQSGPAPLPGMVPTGRPGVTPHHEVSGQEARQIARNQALFREVNERINEIAGDYSVNGGFEILCECASSECRERIELTQTEYERLRRIPIRFAVLRGHDIPAIERVVEENDRFVTIEKVNDMR